MSYARFGWNGSSVYVFLCVSGHLECCACSLGDKWEFRTTDAMLAHLDEHVAAGHTVPADCIERLKAHREENDAQVRELSA